MTLQNLIDYLKKREVDFNKEIWIVDRAEGNDYELDTRFIEWNYDCLFLG